ncbi:MAG: pyridoxal phosphate-dependent aminotransferase [Candidatus Omnitrophica bacterium]|nr:pyridoxal phosphate-dependent aminotransferase [Candidatus Omnitrophota bacterium]
MELSKRITGISPSATLTITSKAKAMKKDGIDVISFGAGEPDFDTPEYIKDAAVAAIGGGKTKYTPSIGTVELRQAICDKLKSFNGLEYKQENIIVSNGAKHSLFNIFQAICQEGDEVIIPAPYWVSYTEMVKLSGAMPVIVGTNAADGFKLKADALAKAIRPKTKAIILNSPSNPTGCVYSKDELESILEVIKDKDIRVVSDEIYERLIYDGLGHTSFASLSDRAKEMTIIVNGVSKTYSMTGWRIGYIASTDLELTKSIKNLQDHSSSNPSSISQEAALAALSKEDDSVEKMKKEFEKRRDYMFERIGSIEKLSCVKPQGAFYSFVDASKVNKDSLEFAKKLLEDVQVAVIPGEGFGAPGFIRLSFATSMENIKEGLDRIEKWLRQ